MPDYPKPSCTNIDFSNVPSLLAMPFKQICGPLPPIFYTKNPETYFGFSAACKGPYEAGYFIINGLDSGKILEDGFDGTQRAAPPGVDHAGTYTVNDYIIRVEEAIVIPGTYQTTMLPGETRFAGYGHPAIIQKIYLNTTDPSLEIDKLPPQGIETVNALLASAKEPNAVWIASPLSIDITKPATVTVDSDIDSDVVTINLQLDLNGVQTVQIQARKLEAGCIAAGTKGFATFQSDAVTDCLGENSPRPVWLFIPQTVAPVVVTNTAVVEKDATHDFIIYGSNPQQIKNARAVSRFNCPDQLGLMFLDGCEWVALPTEQFAPNVSLRAVLAENSNTDVAVATYKLAGSDTEVTAAVARGDVVDAQCFINCLPKGTPGLIITSPADNCSSTLAQFYPFNVINTLVVKARQDLSGVTEGDFEIFNGNDASFACPESAPGFPYVVVTARIPAGTVMCNGDLGILSLGNDCNFIVTPILTPDVVGLFPAITLTDTTGPTVDANIFTYNKVTQAEAVTAVIATRGDIGQINESGDCVTPFLPAGTKGLIKALIGCNKVTTYIFYPTEKTSFFVGSLSGQAIGFKDDCVSMESVPDSICNKESGVEAGFARDNVRLLDDMLCKDNQALVYRDPDSVTCSEWVAQPLPTANSSNFATNYTKTYSAIANEDKPNCNDSLAIKILYYNKDLGGWIAPKCTAPDNSGVVCSGCVAKGTPGIYTITVDSGKARLQLMRDLLRAYDVELPENYSEQNVKDALTALANTGIYPMCEDFVHKDTLESLDGVCGTFTPIASRRVATAIAKENYRTPGTVQLQLIDVIDPETRQGVVVDVLISNPVEAGQVLLIRLNDDCTWEAINPAANNIIIVDTDACLVEDNGTDITVVPSKDIAHPVYDIRKGQQITVPVTNGTFNKFPDDLCIPKHCGGTALFNTENGEWYYVPPAQVLTVSTFVVQAKTVSCNQTFTTNVDGQEVETVEVEYEIASNTGVPQLVTELVECGTRMIPVGTPGQLQKILKTLCTGEKIPTSFFIPSLKGLVPVVARENVDRGQVKDFLIDQDIYGPIPTGASTTVRCKAEDDFCLGDHGIASPLDCNWVARRSDVDTRINISQGRILAVIDSQDTSGGDNTPTSLVSSFCKLFTKLDIQDANMNINPMSPDKLVKIGNKVSVNLFLRDKDCVDSTKSVPNVIEAYAMAPATIDSNCLVWQVRVDCQYYWLCAPIQTFPTLTTVVEFPRACQEGTDCCGYSVDSGFKNPMGGGGTQVCFNSMRYSAGAGSSGIAVMTPAGLNAFRWVAFPIPPMDIFVKVCWGVTVPTVTFKDLEKEYYPAILVDSSGEPTTDPPTKVGVRMDQIRPTRIGNKALYKVVVESEPVRPNSGSLNRFDKYYKLIEDAKAGAYPDAYRDGLTVPNAPSESYVVGTAIDKKKNKIVITDMNVNKTDPNDPLNDCKKISLSFVTNFNWSTAALTTWAWGSVLKVVGQEDDNNLAAHVIGPYGGLVRLESQPITDQDVLTQIINGDTGTFLVWKHLDTESTYAEIVQKEVFPV